MALPAPSIGQKLILTDNEIAYVAQQSGFTPSRKHRGYREDAMAVAIALAETSPPGNAYSWNFKPPDQSYGLWQINMIGDLGPARRKQFNLKDNGDLFNPYTNGRVAYGVFTDAGNSFRPWTTYTRGSWVKYISRAKRAVESPQRPDAKIEKAESNNPHVPDFIEEPYDTTEAAVRSIADAMAFFSDSKNWVRVAGFLGGGMLIIFGLVAVAKESGITGDVAKTALKVVPAGKAVKAARKVI